MANGQNTFSEQDFLAQVKAAREKMDIRRPNILICGYTGAGKTSLVKAILGEVVPADAIGAGKPHTQGYASYENEHVRVFDSKGLELGETEESFLTVTKEFLADRRSDLSKVDDHIHLVWYAIQAPGSRVTECDKQLITKIFNPNNVIVLLTKADIARTNQLEAMKAELMAAGIPEKRIIPTSDVEGGSIGCKELMELSYEMLPNAYRDAFELAQTIDLDRKIQAVYGLATKAKSIIAAAAVAAGGIGFTPIPCSDAPLLVAGQATLIAGLAALYSVGDDAVKVGLLPFLAKVAGTTLASSILKFIPGLGTIAGGMITAAIATSLTGAMGLYVKNYFEELAIAKIKGEPLPEPPWHPELFLKFYEEYKANK